MNYIYPDIKTITSSHPLEDVINIENSTWVRIKRNKKWYEVLVSKKYIIHHNGKIDKEFLLEKERHLKIFIKEVLYTKSCLIINKKTIETMNKEYEVIRKSRTHLKEKDRLYIKVLMERNEINTIL